MDRPAGPLSQKAYLAKKKLACMKPPMLVCAHRNSRSRSRTHNMAGTAAAQEASPPPAVVLHCQLESQCHGDEGRDNDWRE